MEQTTFDSSDIHDEIMNQPEKSNSKGLLIAGICLALLLGIIIFNEKKETDKSKINPDGKA